MTDAGRHPNITLLTLSEVKEITGFVGNFHVKVLKRARYVKEKECTACGDCTKVCPVVVPDEFNMGLSSRRAIYSPFPQAVPSAYVVDINHCLGHNPIICGKCIEKCEQALHRLQHERRGAHLRRGHDHRGHGHGALRPHGPRRIRLHPPRERADEHGVRAPDQRRRSHARPCDPAHGPQDAALRRLHPVRGVALHADGAARTARTSAA